MSYNSAVRKLACDGSIRAVILAARWGIYFEDPQFESALLASIRELSDRGVRVYFLIDVPNFPYDVPKSLAMGHMWGREASAYSMSSDDYEAANRYYVSLLPKLAERGVVILDPVPPLRRRNPAATGDLLPFDSGGCFYMDGNHLSEYGASAIKDIFRPAFDALP